MVLIDIVLDLLGLLDRSDTPMAAYRAAWKRRHRDNDADFALLTAELKQRSVPGAYDPIDSERIRPLVDLWLADVPPKEARREFKRMKRSRSGPSKDI